VRAVLDSADITAMRTGAVAAVAARQLAATGPHVLAVLGAGPVAQQAVAALSEVISIGEIRVWSRDRAPAGQLAAALGNEITVCGSPAEAAAGAGIVLTATPATQPLLTGASLAADALVLAMGADTRGKRELGEGVLDGAELVADVPSEAAVVGELAYLTGGDVVSRCIPLGELLAGSRSLTGGRRIVFDSVGTAVVDAAAVGLVLAVAEREDLGTMIDFAG
jgi:ornithine cyclodeaminase/alanine dehydrogenase-like protein (mu-crystallin family)